MAILESKFSNIFRRSIPLEFPRAIFLFLNLLLINCAEKKQPLKSVKIWCRSQPLKILNTPLT